MNGECGSSRGRRAHGKGRAGAGPGVGAQGYRDPRGLLWGLIPLKSASSGRGGWMVPGSTVLLPNSTESSGSGNTEGRRVLVTVTGSSHAGSGDALWVPMRFCRTCGQLPNVFS